MISFDRYIKIVSGVGAGTTVATRVMALRLLSTNAKLIPGQVYEFANADAVAALANGGTTSELYARAVKYFAMVSKQISKPQMLSVARYTGLATAVGSKQQGATPTASQTLAQWTALAATASFTVDVYQSDVFNPTNPTYDPTNANSNTPVRSVVVNVNDLSAVTDITSIAAVLNASLLASSDAFVKNCTISTSGAVPGTPAFALNGPAPASGTKVFQMACIRPSASGITALMSITQATADQSTWQLPAQAPIDAVQLADSLSDNYGSFAFSPLLPCNTSQVSGYTPSADGQLYDQGVLRKAVSDVADWNHAQNNKYFFLQPVLSSGDLSAMYNGGSATSTVTPTKTVTWSRGIGLSGFGISVMNPLYVSDYLEQCPGEIFAATDYTRAGASQNYMFYSFGNRQIVVSDDTTANMIDALRGNYIGVTRNKLAFYQRGVLMGDSTAAVDMGTFANEAWFKDDIGTRLMAMLNNSGRVPITDEGRAQIMNVIQASIDVAKINGVIAVGKDLSGPDFVSQRQYITTISGDPNAWRQVATIGYWLNVQFNKLTTFDPTRTEWAAAYTLIYAKDDAIRQVTGSDILI